MAIITFISPLHITHHKSPNPQNHLPITSKSSPSLPPLQISNKSINNLCHNPQTLNLILKTLVKTKQWTSISALSKDILLLDGFPDKITCTNLINGCIRAQKFKLVEFLLSLLETKKDVAVSAYGAAMYGYNKLHMYKTTVLVFNRMISMKISPNLNCYYLIMDAHPNLSNTDLVLSIFLNFISDKKSTLSASVHIYSVLCDSLAKSGRAFEALRYFREMIENKISPTHWLYATLISSFAGIRDADIAWGLYQEAKEKGMVKNQDMFMKLVIMYVEIGMPEKTVEIVEEMMEMKFKITDCILSTIINGYAKKRGFLASIKSYEKLKSLGCEPGQVTYALLINVYCRLGLHRNSENTFFEMVESGFDKCVVAYSNIISMYGKNGRVRDAMRLLAMMKEKGCEPNVWVYNSLLDMNGRLLNVGRVEKLWKEMRRRGIEPDRISYTSIICAYNKAGKFEECVKFYDQYKMNGGMADKVLGGIMVGVYSKINEIDDLVKLLKDMKVDGVRFDGRLYKSALNALRDSGLLVHVKWVEENFGCEIEEL